MECKDFYSDPDNDISDSAHIGHNVTMGSGNVVGEFAVIKGRVIIGNDNYIAPHTVIGEPGEYRTPPGDACDAPRIVIGDRNRISEFVAIQSSVLTEKTEVGNDNMIMHGCHIAHDCRVGNVVNLSPLVSLGGSVHIDDYANLGMSAIIHPRLTIGKGVMIGMNSTVTKNINDWELWVGSPARYVRMNDKAIAKYKQHESKH